MSETSAAKRTLGVDAEGRVALLDSGTAVVADAPDETNEQAAPGAPNTVLKICTVCGGAKYAFNSEMIAEPIGQRLVFFGTVKEISGYLAGICNRLRRFWVV